VLEVNQIRRYLCGGGYQETVDKKQADLVVVSTCAVTQGYEDEAVTAINDVTGKKKSTAKVVVSGCLSKINPAVLKALGEHVAVAPLEIDKFETIAPSSNSIRKFVPNSVMLNEYQQSKAFMAAIRLKSVFRILKRLTGIPGPNWLSQIPMVDWFFVRGAHGCMGKCSYCAIKRARGSIRSYKLDDIVRQIEGAVAAGYKTISFAGDDMGCWGADLGLDLADLFKEIATVKGEFCLDIRFVEPHWLLKLQDKLWPFFESGLVASFNAPIQSGSQRILKLMRRDYSVEDVVATTNDVIKRTEVKSIGSILMAGFPGEEVDDYMKTYDLLKRSKIDLWQIFQYEGRPGTPSEKMENKVDSRVKAQRRDRLEAKVKLAKYGKLPEIVSEFIVHRRFGPIV